MKQLIYFLLVLIMLSACAIPKPAYETRAGKKKIKHYNAIMYQHHKTIRR